MEVNTIPCGEYQTNCYVIDHNNEIIIVDPGDDSVSIINEIDIKDSIPVAIILTHGHFDHIFSVDILAKKYKIPVYIHPEDSHYFTLSDYNLSCYYYKEVVLKTKPILLIENSVKIGKTDIRVIETPGHTQGGVCYLIENSLFSGDTIFLETIGRTDMIGGKHNVLLKSVNMLLSTLPDDVVIYPGHGEKTTVLNEKLNNPFYSK